MSVQLYLLNEKYGPSRTLINKLLEYKQEWDAAEITFRTIIIETRGQLRNAREAGIRSFPAMIGGNGQITEGAKAIVARLVSIVTETNRMREEAERAAEFEFRDRFSEFNHISPDFLDPKNDFRETNSDGKGRETGLSSDEVSQKQKEYTERLNNKGKGIHIPSKSKLFTDTPPVVFNEPQKRSAPPAQQGPSKPIGRLTESQKLRLADDDTYEDPRDDHIEYAGGRDEPLQTMAYEPAFFDGQ